MLLYFNNKILISFVTIFVIIINIIECLPSVIRIGGLFTVEQEEQELAFRIAISQLGNSALFSHQSVTFVAQVERVDNFDSFLAQQKVCSLLRNGVVAIFGPQNSIPSMHVQSICETFEIPHIETRLDYESHRTDLSINLYPHPSLLSRVYMDIIKQWEWQSFAIVYDRNDGIIHFKEFFEKSMNHTWNIKVFQLKDDIPFRDIFWKLKESKERNIILDVRKEAIVEVFNQAQQVGLITEEYSYLVTCMDLLTLDLEDFRHSRTNITSLRIVDENSLEFSNLIEEWHIYANRLGKRHMLRAPEYFNTDTVLIYDAVKVLAVALKELHTFEVQPIDCNEERPWPHGSSVINYMRQVHTEGISRVIQFDDLGLRTAFTFDIVCLTHDGYDITGQWGYGKVTKNELWSKHFAKSVLELPIVRVTTSNSPPFTMIFQNKKSMSGNKQYEGYVPDLVNELAKMLNFRVEIHLVKDKQYGKYVPEKGTWNGMIGEVLNDDADIAVADLAVNSDREKVVDFTLPFMSTGISILYKKPITKETSLWSFLSPFSTIVWIYMLGTFIGVSVLLFLTGRFTPYEWCNPHPCRQDDKVLENVLNVRNSFWCTIGSLMQQGSDVAPKALSTRVIIAIWYFFTLIIISSYTANLAAFLTVESIPYPFENVEQLAAQTKIKYGATNGGATHRFFTDSNISTYRKIADFMGKNPDVFMGGLAGRERVEADEGKYAYFMEAAPIEYIVERQCNLTQVGGLLDNKGYAIATRKGSPLRNPLSQAILKLQEDGVLYQLKERWWKQKGGGQCIAKSSSSLTELGLKNLGGVFLVLVGGSIVAVLMALCEFVYKVKKEVKEENFAIELMDDIKFAMRCQISSKPTRSKSKRSLTGSRSFTGSRSESTPKLNSQLSGYYYN
ncbi:glutamate receptor ionotropic, kainate 2-like [Oppia nitens]|uniref:glutamate receptor ionotropic, kainate 2-like n=1 Tax=Oppia nitens TaxID=1686743 RepID=UPI0023D9F0AB|nr:glutamate receptor ionotropic, kainate 2-like [Oppia nitens]